MFRALLLTKAEAVTHASISEVSHGPLAEGEVDVRVAYSTLNFKDALAITGRSPIVKSWPMIPGVDFAGVVENSAHPQWHAGDRVVVTGWELGEKIWGGLAEKCRVPGAFLLKPPASYSARDCMSIATAGVTAALCARALQRHGLTPESGEIVVTGAAGGVGSVAVALLAGLGFEVVASTGRPAERDYLRGLGATRVVDRNELSKPGRGLQSERWSGAVDTVGSHTLANVCAATKWNGAVAACGLAQGADFPATVLPFILRGVTLYGINSVFVENATRYELWQLLAEHISAETLSGLTHEIGLSQAIAYAPEVLAGRSRGRVVVDVNR